MRDTIRSYSFNFRALGPDHFIWIPIKDVPVIEQFPINSLKQPALSYLKLVEWNAIDMCATDNQQYLADLASSHKEMGYFLFHDGENFGIIGVEEDYGPGRASIFNARTLYACDDKKKLKAIKLKIIHTSVKLPWKGVAYSKGHIAYYRHVCSDHDTYDYWEE